MTSRLPTHEVKLLRAFARTEMLAWYHTYAGTPWWRRVFSGLPEAGRICIRMIKRGEELGLPRRTTMRAIHAEIDTLDAAGY